ncbi:hypothetical protein [Streptomyces sp. NRRL WC-3742]|uniref:hypothetical protein n=1 Tax=Streptomyces sp. NRRL WC-3742 TaxID=1463934 RepID=UPI0004C9C08E|nr:hypothetical protein [Streptomyces sp. NRRL WC-3742]
MTDPHAEQPNTRHYRECEDCHAAPDSGDIRITTVGRDLTVSETWHTAQCPAYTVEQILMEAGAAQVKEQSAWAKEAFPAAHGRLRAAATALPAGTAADPFVAALLELVQAQADDTGRFVALPTWAEILQRHFPPQDPV